MHPQQRHARFNLIVLFSALVPSVLGYALLFTLVSPRGAWGAVGFLGILGLWGFGGHFYQTKKGAPAIIMDERDEDIRRRALLNAWVVQWLFLGLLCMVPWFIAAFRFGFERPEESVMSIHWLPVMYMAVAIVHQFTWSSSVLVLYRKGASSDAV